MTREALVLSLFLALVGTTGCPDAADGCAAGREDARQNLTCADSTDGNCTAFDSSYYEQEYQRCCVDEWQRMCP